MKRFCMTLGLLLVSLCVTPAAVAQSTWPSRPVRIIVPFAPGSFTDISARAYAAELRPAVATERVEREIGTWKDIVSRAGVKVQ